MRFTVLTAKALYWRDWRKPHNQTDWTQADDKER